MSVKVTERAMTEAEKRARQERERFQKWGNAKGAHIESSWNGEFYENKLVESAWQGWQARASEESDGWISVNDELPPIGQDVMVVIDGILQKCPAARCEDGWEWFIEDADMAPLNIVTHWRPLPSPPSAAQDGTPTPICPGCGVAEGSNHNFDCPEAQD